MTNWKKYWRSKNHTPKALCSGFWLCEIDSFEMFKNQQLIQLVRDSENREVLEIPRYNLIATLAVNNSLNVVYDGGAYTIPVEKLPCNYGGFYYFYHCPKCNTRMRKLYCLNGKYLCRKCAHLGYYSQRLRPSERNAHMSYNVIAFLKNRAGSLERKPPWMKKHTFQKLRIKYVKYDEKYFGELNKELIEQYGAKGEYYLPPYGMYNAWVKWI